jgi:putative flippase GtrA
MKFFLYCLCGGAGVLTDLIVYYTTLGFDVFYVYANALGYLIGTLVSFILNRKITFGITDKVSLRLALFLCVALAGFSISAMLLWLLVYFFYVTEQIAKLLTLPVVVVVQFFLNKWLTFNGALTMKIFQGISK